MTEYARHKGFVAMKKVSSVPLTLAVTLWPEAEYHTDSSPLTLLPVISSGSFTKTILTLGRFLRKKNQGVELCGEIPRGPKEPVRVCGS